GVAAVAAHVDPIDSGVGGAELEARRHGARGAAARRARGSARGAVVLGAIRGPRTVDAARREHAEGERALHGGWLVVVGSHTGETIAPTAPSTVAAMAVVSKVLPWA